MTYKRNAVRKDGLDGWQAFTPAFDFHEISTGGTKLARIFESQFRSCTTPGRQVSGDKCFHRPTSDGARVVNHVIHRDMRGVGMPQNNHSQRVANQQEIKPTLVEKARGWIIVSRKRGQPAAFSLGLAE